MGVVNRTHPRSAIFFSFHALKRRKAKKKKKEEKKTRGNKEKKKEKTKQKKLMPFHVIYTFSKRYNSSTDFVRRYGWSNKPPFPSPRLAPKKEPRTVVFPSCVSPSMNKPQSLYLIFTKKTSPPNNLCLLFVLASPSQHHNPSRF